MVYPTLLHLLQDPFHIVLSLLNIRDSTCFIHRGRPRVVCRQRQFQIVLVFVQQLPDIRGTGLDVLTGVEYVVHLELLDGGRRQLHQPHCAFGGNRAGAEPGLLAAAGAAYWFLRPAPVVPLGALELNATPFAEIVSVTSDKGKVVALPAGDHWTPFRLDDVPLGRYTVGFKGTAGSTQQQQCAVAQSAQICTIELKPIDDSAIDQIVGATK